MLLICLLVLCRLCRWYDGEICAQCDDFQGIPLMVSWDWRRLNCLAIVYTPSRLVFLDRIQNSSTDVYKELIVARQNLQPGVLEENLSRASTVPYYAHGRQHRCQEDPVCLPSGRLEKTTRSSPHHVSQHRPTGSETTPPCAPRSSRFGSEPPSVEDDVDVGGWSFPVAASQIWNSLPDTVVPAPIENFFISTILYLLAL